MIASIYWAHTIWYLEWTLSCLKYILKPYNPIEEVLLLLLIYRLENWALGMFNNLLKVPWFVNGRAGINSLTHFNNHWTLSSPVQSMQEIWWCLNIWQGPCSHGTSITIVEIDNKYGKK